MRQLYLAFIFIGLTSSAQIVNIPDANFKNRLVNTICATLTPNGQSFNSKVDTNNDGEIQETEAAAVYRLMLQNSEIISLEGIAAFTNLRELYANSNLMTSVDLSGVASLKQVQVGYNQLTSAAFNPAITYIEIGTNLLTNVNFISNLSNLNYIGFSGNLVTSVDFSGNPNLISMECEGNQLILLDVSGLHLNSLDCNHNQLKSLLLCPEIEFLRCNHNSLTSLDLSLLNGIQLLDVSYNQLTTFEIPPVLEPNNFLYLAMSGNLYTSFTLPSDVNYYEFVCEDTQLTSLTVPGFFDMGTADAFYINNNQHLESVNLKNGFFNICIYNGGTGEDWCTFKMENNPVLKFVCLDDDELGYTEILNYIDDQNPQDITFSSYCSFTPGGNYNTVTGNIKYDFSSNGCDVSDAGAPNISILASASTFPVGNTFTNNDGSYISYSTNYGPGINLTLTPQFENPYFTITPATFTSAFSDFGNTETANFCIAPNGVHPDLDITIIPLTPARPGFDATYKIHYENKGTETASGEIAVDFNDNLTDFVSANPSIASQSTNILTWNFNNLAPFQSGEITFTLNVNSPLETPPVNIGGILEFNASVDSGADETPEDNTTILQQTVVGSYDPNDKAVSRTLIDIAELGDYLYYTVRFQNTGTFMAENVVVKDMLSDKLDWSTLEMVSASHQYRSTLTYGNKLEFFFEGINLPASVDDEPASHGYITFKIKPKNTVLINETIENQAEIYFDFNAPIVTNPVSTYVWALGTDEFSANTIRLYPNPAKNNFTIEVDGISAIKSISVYNTIGQLMKTVSPDENQISINLSNMTSGTYFVKVITDNGTTTKKLIKL